MAFRVTGSGTWSFDGTTLREFVEAFDIEPIDTETHSLVKETPEMLTELKQQVMSDKSYANVAFIGDDEIALVDQET